MFDLKIVGGTIVDGTGRAGYRGDIGINGDRITAIGDLSAAESARTIDAAGKVVAPGLIDFHTHSDLSLLIDGHAMARLHDGVTTDVIGNCGIGTYPARKENRQLLLDYLGTRIIGSLPVKNEVVWDTAAEYYAYCNAHPASINIALLLAQGSVRIAEMGFAMGRATAEQTAHMQDMVTEAMEAGALGLTTGLAYLPGAYTDCEELCEVAKPLHPFGGVYISHIRNQADRIFESITEAIRIGQAAQVPVHISHLKLAGPVVRGKTEELFRCIEKARQEGTDVSFDLYPYDAGNTAITTVLPPWVFEGGIKNLLARVGTPELRQKIREDCARGIPGWQNYSVDLGWQKICISSTVTEEGRQWEGMTIQEIADARRKDPWDAVFDLLIQEGARIQTIVSHLDEKDVEAIIAHPDAIYGSDSMSLSCEGLLSSGKPHPRAFGTHGTLLGKYVREKKLMTLEQAVQKMTQFPARRLNIRDRGVLKEGFYADITVFDPRTIDGKATYQQPKQYTEGVEAVVVNGQVAMEKGVHQKVFSGRIVGR